MLKMEVMRLMRRPTFIILLLVGFAVGLIPVIQTWPHGVDEDYYVLYPRSAYISWMYFISPVYLIYVFVFPLFASLVYADTYAEDFNTGLIKGVLTKINKFHYLNVRFLVNFIAGGMMSALPLIINFMGELAAYPLIDNNFYFGMPLVTESSFWPDLFYSHPFLYIVLRLVLIFLFGGMLASLGLALSIIIKNRYIVSIFPFLVVLGLDVINNAFGKSPISQLYLGNRNETLAIVIYLFIGIVGSYSYFILMGKRHETY